MKGHKPSTIYTETKAMDGEHSNEDGQISRDRNDIVQEDGHNQQDEEWFTIVELLNITNIYGVF